MNKTDNLKVLITGNGNLTARDGNFFVHHEIAAFLREMRALGLKTEYATIVLDAGDEAVKNLADEKFPADIPVHTFKSLSHMPRWKRPFATLAAVAKAAFLVMRYDFVYCYYPGALGRMIAFFCRLLHRRYGLNVRGEVPPTRMDRSALNKASFILADGACNVTRVVPEYKHCCEIVPMCAIFNEDIAPVERDFSNVELHGLFVGRVERNKGMFELFEAMAELKRRGVAVRMKLVGAYGEEMPKEVRRLDIADRIDFAGLAKDPETLKGFYRDADFFCLPTYTEGFPRVLYEAMAHGLPCLTTLVGGIPSRMHAGENCLALEPRSADSIVRAITSIVEDRELAKRLSAASTETFRYWQKRFAGSSHSLQLRDMIFKSRGEKCC